MFWCNVLRRAGSDYCVNDISSGPFANFRLKIFTQEKNRSFGDPCLKFSTVMYRFKLPLSKCLVIVAKEL